VYLSFPSLPFFLVVAYSKDGWTDLHDLYKSNDADSPKDVPFWGFDDKNIVQGPKKPQNTPKVGVVRQFQAKSRKN